MITKEAIETAYCFLHQKQRVYQYSTMDWQKEDIEYAIGSYLDGMQPELYALLARDRTDYLRSHQRFGEDMINAVEKLEDML